MSTDPPYSRLRRAGDLVVTAGILGRRDGQLVAGGVAAELAQALDNLEALLDGEGLSERDVVRLVVYLTDIDAMGELNEQFTARFTEPRPARTTVQVAGLPGGASVELEATAAG